MELRSAILSALHSGFKDEASYKYDFGDSAQWEYATFLRGCCYYQEHGEPRGWEDFSARFAADSEFARAVRMVLNWGSLTAEEASFIRSCVARLNQDDVRGWEDLAERSNSDFFFGPHFNSFLQTVGGSLNEIRSEEWNDVLILLQPPAKSGDEAPSAGSGAKSAVMYIERKAGNLTGPARIGRVTFSKTGKTIYYKGQQFRSLKGRGFKANYFDVAGGEDEEYWISRPRRDGRDRLYGERQPVEIDEEAREEYWTRIRRQPDNTQRTVV